jgi:hypothetical protein
MTESRKGPVRYYETHPEELRPVRVRVDKFTGYGKHIHVTMKEADDPIWDDQAGEWVIPTDPEDPGHGVERVMKFNRRAAARKWIETTFEQEFDTETHELQVEEGESYQWFYGEGE